MSNAVRLVRFRRLVPTWLRLSLTVVLALVLCGAPGSASAARIVYVAEQEAAFLRELYLVDLAMPGQPLRLNRPLSPFANGVNSFVISPDGASVVYAADQTAAGDTDLFLVDITALGVWTRIGALAAGHQELFAKFSPDGGKIAFTASDSSFGNVELYLVDLARPSDAVRLNGDLVEHGAVSMTGFEFSPDGSRVVYTAAELERKFELYVVNVSEPGRSTRLNGPGGSVGDSFEGRFAIPADSTGVVYSAVGDNPGVRELHFVAFDEPALPVTLNAPLQADGDVLEFTVSPDGRRVLYVADQETDIRGEVFLVDLGLPGTARRLNGPVQTGAAGATFTPDGRYVIYSGDEDRGPGERDLYRVEVAQPNDPVRVNDLPDGGADIVAFSISADGSSLAYTPDPPGGFRRDLMVVGLGAAGSDLRLNGPLADGALEFPRPKFSPDDDAIAFIATESLADSIQELFFARLSEPGVSVRLNAPLPHDAVVSSNPGSFAFLAAGAPPTGQMPAGGEPGGPRPDAGGGGAVGLPAVLLLLAARLARRRPGHGNGPRPTL